MPRVVRSESASEALANELGVQIYSTNHLKIVCYWENLVFWVEIIFVFSNF